MKAGILTKLKRSPNSAAMHFFRTRKKLWTVGRTNCSKASRRNTGNPNSKSAIASSNCDFYEDPGFDCRRNILGNPPKCRPKINFVRKSEQESNGKYSLSN